ncbi:MAG TPA: TIGR03619 family F420-dependent LLM class oxidoreductase [Acidimicrobiales bacterium]|nr:TIGR03619 family F420-dependent LLM class oxidoreductase [Acidimicrobiales bacterium]
MKPVVAVFADLTDRTMGMVEFAQAAEARGFGGIFLNEHTHLPVSHPTSQFPAGGEIPERYARFWDPYIALSFVAAVTALEIGTAISLIAEHDPIQLGHATATLDHLSGGRLVLGVGWGWHREEYADHGRRPEERAQVVEEWVHVLRSMWRDEVASYAGRYVTLSPSYCWPKPLQSGGPPVLLGAKPTERNFARIARFADGWITDGSPVEAKSLFEQVSQLRAHWSDAGRRAEDLRISVVHNPQPGALPLHEVVAVAADCGIERVLQHIYEGDRDAMLRRLDRAATDLRAVT